MLLFLARMRSRWLMIVNVQNKNLIPLRRDVLLPIQFKCKLRSGGLLDFLAVTTHRGMNSCIETPVCRSPCDDENVPYICSSAPTYEAQTCCCAGVPFCRAVMRRPRIRAPGKSKRTMWPVVWANAITPEPSSVMLDGARPMVGVTGSRRAEVVCFHSVCTRGI